MLVPLMNDLRITVNGEPRSAAPGTTVAALIAEQRPPVAPSQDERGTEASRPAADNENIELH